MTPVVSVQGITRTGAAGRVLLDDITMDVMAGEGIALVGPSGSGKSTLLRAIARLDPIRNGYVKINGDTITSAAIPNFRRRVVYLAQRPAMIVGTVEQNLQLPFSFASSQSNYDRARAIDLLGELDRLEGILDQDASTLSGGEQQLVSLVRAILVDPEVMLLDEPTASLDAASLDRFESLASGWKNGDPRRAWVWTSHDADQIDRMTTRTIRLAGGRITHE
ncbi:putative ABC transporter ATP-binding protein YbbL [Rubripirellula tenax]|uniref:Putative ABC transporter ATP-binding protein YbbL n=2 Tax=Rubripirellula tenax TaxID=2528015 RepID=A0A5C6F470_9BACT|nr:putative ABC transporter ATP-binding protein YbbL [Rubripirellula tenax]